MQPIPFFQRERSAPAGRSFLFDKTGGKLYNYSVINYIVFDRKEMKSLANRNHALDEKIIKAARDEFLEKGYSNASLRKIAEKAAATAGAIQIRYKTKDALFCSLLQPFLAEIEKIFQDTRTEYWQYPPEERLDFLEKSMEMESEAILNLIFDHGSDAVLLLCRSEGSSLAGCFDQIVERKVQESAAFFNQAQPHLLDENLLRLLIAGQFHSYYQIVKEGYEKDAARGYLQALMRYHMGGWTALLKAANARKGKAQ